MCLFLLLGMILLDLCNNGPQAMKRRSTIDITASRASHLLNDFLGRAQRLRPEKQPQTAVVCKPSREGEVKLQCSMTGNATRSWFRQLRRLQSLKHSVMAGKQTADALIYRAELWQAIQRSRALSLISHSGGASNSQA